jgi:hypothetical protein
VRIGAAVFGIGLLAVLADLVPFFLGHPNRPLLVNLGAFLAPLGLGLALGGLLRAARASQRVARSRAAAADYHGSGSSRNH